MPSNTTALPTDQAQGVEKLELRYVPLGQAQRWDANPKRHDLDRLVVSIETHGFGDPPKFDASLGAIVYGNGRTEALERMRDAGKVAPRGIVALEDGNWAVPVIFGVDAESKAAATAFAVDHNQLTLLGGGFDLADLLQIWDEEALHQVLAATPEATDLLASFDSQDLDALLNGPEFEPVRAEEQSRLDERKQITCPECGHEFQP